MSLTYVNHNTLYNSGTFTGRIEAACLKYAVYLRGQNATGNIGNWAAEILINGTVRSDWVHKLAPYVVNNVAVNGSMTAGGDDVDSTDAAISAEVETQINAQVT